MNLHLRRGRTLHPAPVVTSLGSPQIAGSSALAPASPFAPTAPLAPVVPLPRTEAVFGEPPLTTPFEDWCERAGVHPEALGAWEAFTWETTPGA